MAQPPNIKEKMLCLIDAVLYYSGIAVCLLYLRRIFNQGRNELTILTYHSVNDELLFPYYPAVSRKNFYRQIRFLKRHFKIISFAQLLPVAKDKMKLPTGAMIITFDDGFKDNFTNAYPLFKKYNLLATIFLATDCLEANKLLWHHLLYYLKLKICAERLNPALRMELVSRGIIKNSDLSKAGSSEEEFLRIKEILKDSSGLDLEEKFKILETISRNFGIKDEGQITDGLYLSWEDVVKMSNNHIEFGAHSCSHQVMSRLKTDDIYREISLSKKIIEDKVNQRVLTFAYPFEVASNRRVKSALEELDFRFAVTAEKGVNCLGADPYALKRINVEDKTVAWLACELASINRPFFNIYRILKERLKEGEKCLKKKIIYVDKSSEIGGAETSLLMLIKHLNREVFEPVVVLPAEGALSRELEKLKVKVFIVPLHNICLKWLNPWPYLTTVWRLVKVIHEEGAVLVHANDVAASQYGVVAAKLAGVPIVCHLRENLYNRRIIRRGFLDRADWLIANSHWSANTFRSFAGNRQKISVIHNYLDLQEFLGDENSGAAFRRRFGIPESSFLVGIVGRIFADKGHHILLQAVSKIRKENPDICVAIIGALRNSANCSYLCDEDFVSGLRQMVFDSGMEKQVFFIEGDKIDIVSAYRAFDVLAAPTFAESFGRTLIEAMAVNKPVIASKVGGIIEIVEDEITGMLFEPGDAEQLSAALRWLIREPALAEEMGRKGRERVEKMFSISDKAEKTQRIYLNLLFRGE